MALLTCKNSSFGYDTGAVISGLDFSVNAGDYLCIVGENGAGKSTLIKGLLRLIKPVSGEVLAGSGLSQENIGYLAQQTEAQKDFPAGVLEVVLSGRQAKRGLRPFYGREDKRVALQNLEKIGLEALKSRCFSELSGGQQRRALLARALCATEKLLILDEPAAGLDPLAAGDMYKLIQMLNRELGLTIIMASHDIRGAFVQASHILHLGNTQLFFGTTGEYLETELAKRFLGGEGIV